MPKQQPIARRALTAAVTNANNFWRAESARLTEQKGFGMIIVPDAPDTVTELHAAWEHSCRTGQPFPVSSLYSDMTIYGDPVINAHLRFGHDGLHVSAVRGFGVDDEYYLGERHVEQGRRAGFAADSLEIRIIEADTIGATLMFNATGRFPIIQKLFVINVMQYGIDTAITFEQSTERGVTGHEH